MQALRRAVCAGASASARRLSVSSVSRVDEAATAAATKTFLEKFAQRAPSTMAPPNFPADYRARPATRRGVRGQPARERHQP